MAKDKFCSSCGEELKKDVKYCSNCGAKVSTESKDTSEQPTDYPAKSKIAAGVLGILVGSLGIHNFYLGYNSKGIAQLLLTTVGWIACGLGPIIAGAWGLVDGILILTGSINKDANGNKLQD